MTTKGKRLKVGQLVKLATAAPVLLDGVVVVPASSPAMGEITRVKNKGMWGKSGHLDCGVLYVDVNGRRVRLNGTFNDKGVAGGIGAVAMAAFVWVTAGFFVTGTSAKLPVGTIVNAVVDQDLPVGVDAAAPPLAATPVAVAMADGWVPPAI